MKRLLGISLLLVSLGAFGSCGQDSKKKSTPGPQDKVFTVSVASAVVREIPDVLSYQGQFIPIQRLEVKSDFTGKVQALSVVEGQSVLTGDVLLKIEDEKLPWVLDRQRAELREAEAQMEMENQVGSSGEQGDAFEEYPEEEEEEFTEEEPVEEEEFAEEEEEDFTQDEELTPQERLARLRRRAARARARARAQRQSAAPQPAPAQAPEPVNEEALEAKQNYHQAKIDRIRAEISLTEKQVAGSTLIAPFEGFVNQVKVSEGSLVKPEQLLLDIVMVDPLDLSFSVPKNEIGKIDKKMDAKVVIPDLQNKNVTGQISFIGAELGANQRAVEVRVRVDNREGKIKLGMEGIAYLSEAKAFHSATLVPESAIIRIEGKPYVYVVRGQVAEQQPVTLGNIYEGWIEIKKGIKSSDRVVTGGVGQLKSPEEYIKLGGA